MARILGIVLLYQFVRAMLELRSARSNEELTILAVLGVFAGPIVAFFYLRFRVPLHAALRAMTRNNWTLGASLALGSFLAGVGYAALALRE
jgi:hypothetical protein